ncbi:histidine phosphatase family protein [Fulvimarina endophytica]|uniref:Histidine phosphatase family protein n=1 Tax=Fulvimarina endophytica TaxID=2293836 RepID=A0A371X3A2_9HYPH|nr:histidine phosphatase family protein [Fulvimarina endophytica]RFC63708.1 histidine phosphatase family protein [Fulvimarina endophytica]
MATKSPRLFVLRHAHSSWALPGQRDHQRVLDERGRRDAERLADELKDEAIEIDSVLCSTAARARETFEIAKPAFARIGKTTFTDDLYAFGPEAYVAAIEAETDASTILVVGHNPMIEDFALSLVGTDSKAYQKLREGLPTCGFAEFACEDGFATMAKGGASLSRLLLPREMA